MSMICFFSEINLRASQYAHHSGVWQVLWVCLPSGSMHVCPAQGLSLSGQGVCMKWVSLVGGSFCLSGVCLDRV